MTTDRFNFNRVHKKDVPCLLVLSASGIISFGLVAIPVKLYSAASSQSVSYNLLHAKCGNRIREQRICPVCNEVLEKTDLIKGFEFAKDQYVRLTDEELKGLEGEASEAIEITEFVPLAKVDPIYFEKTYYLGPDKGGEKPYRLLADAMTKAAKVALGEIYYAWQRKSCAGPCR